MVTTAGGPASDRLEIELYCPQCGQKLVIPAHDLNHSYQCPRCRAIDAAHNLVARDRPLAAIPIGPSAAANTVRDLDDVNSEGTTLIGTTTFAAAKPLTGGTTSDVAPPSLPPTPWAPAPSSASVNTAPQVPPPTTPWSSPPAPPPPRPPGPTSSAARGGPPPPPPRTIPEHPPLALPVPTDARPGGWPFASSPPPSSPSMSSTGLPLPPPPTATPDPHSLPSSAQDLGAAAFTYARAGVRWTGQVLQALAAAAARFDAQTYGHRRHVISGLAVVLVIAQFVSLTRGSIAFEWFVGTILLVVLFAYALARVQDFRDESGQFTPKVAIGNLVALVRFVLRRDESKEDDDIPTSSSTLPRRLLEIGLAVLALRSLLLVIGGTWRWMSGASTPTLDTVLGLMLLAWLPVVYGGYKLLSELSLRIFGRRSAEPELALEPVASAEVAVADVVRLPHALDLVGTNARDREALHAIQDPVLKKIVAELPHWRPRKTTYEAEYQAALARFLRRRLRGHAINEQFPLQDFDRSARPRRRRVDIVIDDTIAIEIKPRIDRAGDIQRAVGQVREYAEMWQGRGPMILLVCETRADFESTFAVRQLALRDPAMATTMVVAAGVRV